MKGWIDGTVMRSQKTIATKININNVAFIQDIEDYGEENKTRIHFNSATSSFNIIVSVRESYSEIIKKIEEAI